MGEVKRKRPWEQEQMDAENNMLETFFRQLILSTCIILGVLIVLSTKHQEAFKQIVHSELTKTIDLKSADAFINEIKETASRYIR